MLGVILATALLAPSDLGLLFRHHKPASSPGCCDECGVESARVAALICRLQTSPRWRERDNAAHALRRVEWECHPEAPLALVQALLCDPEEEVREEAAESLAKMKPCLPEVHAALDRASKCDPDHATRKWARRGLANLGKECVADCTLCGNLPAHVVRVPAGPGQSIEPPLYAEPPLVLPPGYSDPLLPPPADVLPPTEMPPIPSGASPFSEVRSARPMPLVPPPGRVRAG